MQISYLLFTLFPHLTYLFYYHMKREKDIIFSFSFFFSLKIRTSVTLFAFGHYVENYILAFVVFFLSCFFFLADFFWQDDDDDDDGQTRWKLKRILENPKRRYNLWIIWIKKKKKKKVPIFIPILHSCNCVVSY